VLILYTLPENRGFLSTKTSRIPPRYSSDSNSSSGSTSMEIPVAELTSGECLMESISVLIGSISSLVE